MYLTDEDLREVIDLSWRLSGIRCAAELVGAILLQLRTLLGGHRCGLHELDLDQGLLRSINSPTDCADQRPMARLAELIEEHPIVRHILATPMRQGVVRLGDLVSPADLARSALYREVLLPMGARDQIAVLVDRPTPTRGVAYVICRDGAFHRREVDLAGALLPTLAALHRVHGLTPSGAQLGPANPCGLTAREVHMLQLVATGNTAQAIAHTCQISDRTVRKHLENAYRKLGHSDRLSAVERARELGLVPRATVSPAWQGAWVSEAIPDGVASRLAEPRTPQTC